MTINRLFIVLALSLSLNAFAHDEGHGPKLTDSPQKGGIKVSPVIDSKDVKKGAKATLLYKAELYKNDEGQVKVYFYDTEMKPIGIEKLGKVATGAIEWKNRKTKKFESKKFTLTSEGDAFVGKAPMPPQKPFNIDVMVKANGKDLLAAFDNLD